MKCNHIIVVTCIGFGDDDKEIMDNSMSLMRRYKNKNNEYKGQRCHFYAILCTNRGLDKTNLESISKRFEKDYKEDDTIGIYLLCHGGPGQINPDIKTIHKILLEFINRKITPNKVNLAACFSGNKLTGAGNLSDAKFSNSHANNLCKLLLQSHQESKIKLPHPFMICCYTSEVTTWDPSKKSTSSYIGKLTQKEWNEGELPIGGKSVRSARLIRARDNKTLTDAQPMRPHVTTYEKSLTEINENLQELTGKFENEAWKTYGKQILKGKYKSLAEARESGRRINQNGLKQYQRHVRDSITKTFSGGSEKNNRIFLQQIEAYIKSKIILIFIPDIPSFRVGSLREYSDTQLVQELIESVEKSKMLGESPEVTLRFHPD